MTYTSFSALARRGGNLPGIGLMLLAILMFSLNDTLGKWLVATYSVGQILVVRSIAALILLSPFILRSGVKPFLSIERPRLQALRVLLGGLEVGAFYLAVSYLPLADAMTFYMAGPIYVTAMSALMLGEKVGIYRWCAVVVGFVGVVVALQPSAGSLGTGSLVAIAASLLYSMLLVATRYLRHTPNTVLVSTQIAGSLTFGLIISVWDWVPVAPSDLALLALLGVVSVSAFALVNASLKLSPASVVVPFQYTLLIWALVFGYLFFGNLPQAHTIAGAVIIVAAGLFIFVREQRVEARKALG